MVIGEAGTRRQEQRASVAERSRQNVSSEEGRRRTQIRSYRFFSSWRASARTPTAKGYVYLTVHAQGQKACTGNCIAVQGREQHRQKGRKEKAEGSVGTEPTSLQHGVEQCGRSHPGS